MGNISFEEDRDRHKELVSFLSKFEAFKDDKGNPILNIKKNKVDGYKPENFSNAEISRIGVLIVDALNLASLSVGERGFNVSALLRGYFLDEEKRKKINDILK